MVDTAAQLFCRPKITFTIKQHMTGGKTIVEVEVIKGNKRPYQAKDENGFSYELNPNEALNLNR
jgi:predicted HTH transcriptional regulator